MPSDAELANQALIEENSLRFSSFSSSDAVTLGLSIRKRFRASSRHAKGKGIVISIESVGGHTLFACTVGDLGAGMGDVSLDSWCCVKGMIKVVNRTGHSSFYVEKGMAAIGKTPEILGIPSPEFRCNGGGRFQPRIKFHVWCFSPGSFSRLARGLPGFPWRGQLCNWIIMLPECPLLSNRCCRCVWRI